ncbi:hypothetical protein [Streptomyces sp. ME19-01-6]|uniref:hypothetical protein n=1 Tax=Streptomyces sp. ME19-01-6 TaxID=3028686 RepID=UPI0029B5FD4D|nr:hypothetical protein [Streptomyces sp. ME19-01-6]MDX3230092.1 hypothetical protein [Streptomyces sp. ME19-01-6]
MSDARMQAACAQRSRLRAVAGDGRDAGPQTTTKAAPLRRVGDSTRGGAADVTSSRCRGGANKEAL